MCDARIRPFHPINAVEVRCELDHFLDDPGPNAPHEGELRDFAFPDSSTVIRWLGHDRRQFVGDWPGGCDYLGCVLPAGHPGNHAT